MEDIFSRDNSRLDDIIADISEAASLEKTVTKTVSIRLPVLHLAQIDVLAQMKDASRNILLNDIITAALSELLQKLAQKNPVLSEELQTKAAELAQHLLKEPEPPHMKHGPKKRKK